tara:strand:+ start:5117 stop:6193 length:1077 start_codon:yes stop_codon:yes gene_type:complete
MVIKNNSSSLTKTYLGNCLDVLKTLPDNSVDSIVTDPPYGLSFMSKKWDYDVPSKEIWIECLRVLKHGGHLLAFGGTRTYHRLVVQIEDAGFEIRDQIQWLYGTGFPKSLNISKAIDKAAGAKREEAEQWDGWGTALKPANEPICLVRKPIKEKTVAANAIEHGTGALNIDGCRIGDIVQDTSKNGISPEKHKSTVYKSGLKKDFEGKITIGRFPANVILDEEAGALLDEQSGVGASRFFYCSKPNKSERNAGCENFEPKHKSSIQTQNFENAKTGSGNERNILHKNNHPTVKPIKLMRYLCRLITPPNGTVLDPFMGSGTTGIGAMLEGFDFIGIEMEEEYIKIAEARIEAWKISDR